MQWLRLAVSSGLLLGVFVFLHWYSHGEAVPIRRPLESFPMRIGSWQGRESALLSDAILEQLRPTDYLMRRYQGPAGQDLWLYVGYWETQREGAQIHSPKNCLPGGGWQPLEASVVPVPVNGRADPIPVNRYVLQKGADELLVAYWFQAEGEPVANELKAKIALVRNSIFRHRSDGAIVRISTPVSGDVSTAWALLLEYIRLMYPKLHGFLPN
jgi:EpsI family protein